MTMKRTWHDYEDVCDPIEGGSPEATKHLLIPVTIAPSMSQLLVDRANGCLFLNT